MSKFPKQDAALLQPLPIVAGGSPTAIGSASFSHIEVVALGPEPTVHVCTVKLERERSAAMENQ